METETGFGTSADMASKLNKIFRFYNTDKVWEHIVDVVF